MIQNFANETFINLYPAIRMPQPYEPKLEEAF